MPLWYWIYSFLAPLGGDFPAENHLFACSKYVPSQKKVIRGLKKEDTPIVEGHRLYHNFIKPHEALKGKTPSEEAGITIEGNNKWLILMRRAIQYQKSKES